MTEIGFCAKYQKSYGTISSSLVLHTCLTEAGAIVYSQPELKSMGKISISLDSIRGKVLR
jgi:hypothetical protein